MPPFKECKRCKHGFYCCEPIQDWQCFYIIDAGHSRPIEFDHDGKCGTFEPMKGAKFMATEDKKGAKVHIVCFSGGHSSAIAAIETVRKYGKHNVVLLNHDISSKVEDADIKRFKEDISNYCDVPITYANAPDFEELTPLEVCRRRKGFSAGTHQKFCTYALKTEPFYKYLSQFEPSKKIHLVYGFDENEPTRISRKIDAVKKMGLSSEFPLIRKARTIERTEDIGIPRPSTYRIWKHANCTGCLKAGKQHWYCVYCLRPEIFEEAKETEAQIGYSIIKETLPDGGSRPLFLAELEPMFREMKEQKHIIPTDKTNSASFWAEVNSVLPEQDTLFDWGY